MIWESLYLSDVIKRVCFLVPVRMAGVLRQARRIVIKLDIAKPVRPRASTQTHKTLGKSFLYPQVQLQIETPAALVM